MKSIEEIKSKIPNGVKLWCETSLKKGIEEYAKKELGEDNYSNIINLKSDSDINELDAMSKDFEQGFWFGVELFNLNFS